MMENRCKVCGNQTGLLGSVDFSKNCEERRGLHLAPSGTLVEYRRCQVCGFVFTPDFDSWPPERFASEIYNHAYTLVDPDYLDVRPKAMAGLILRTFASSVAQLSVLDYGSGSGRFAELLSPHTRAMRSYDPFGFADSAALSEQYDIVTCFEVLEHDPKPSTTIETLARASGDRGIVIFSTLVQDAEFERDGVAWWYIAPRNGHISIFSRTALATAWNARGFQVASMNDDLHVAFRTVPSFARHLFPRHPDLLEGRR